MGSGTVYQAAAPNHNATGNPFTALAAFGRCIFTGFTKAIGFISDMVNCVITGVSDFAREVDSVIASANFDNMNSSYVYNSDPASTSKWDKGTIKNVKSKEQLEELKKTQPLLYAYLTQAADKNSDLHRLTTDAKSTYTQKADGSRSLWEKGVVTIMDTSNNTVAASAAISGKGPNSEIDSKDIANLATQLETGRNGNFIVIFYHDHAENSAITNGDINNGAMSHTIVMAGNWQGGMCISYSVQGNRFGYSLYYVSNRLIK
jgi:hypothetical protein